MSYTIKCRSGNYLYPMVVTPSEGRLYLKFPFNLYLKDEVKAMSGARWDPENKQWHVTNNTRNLFALQILGGGNPYARYDKPLIDFKPRRYWLMSHQKEMAAFALTRHYGLFSCEMGTGKTLAAIEAMETSGTKQWWWVGPRNAIFSVKNEFKKWSVCDRCNLPEKPTKVTPTLTISPCQCSIFLNANAIAPRFLSYEELRKEVDCWPKDRVPPQGIIYDEASRCKNPTAQRSQAAQAMADAIREHWGEDGFAIEMTGSPAPHDPTDWWSICEIAQPGYLREGNIQKFRQRLSVIEQRENTITGGTYPHLITWLDNPLKCNVCGQLENHPAHNIQAGGHSWIESKDEVSYLYRRMNGLVLVKLKKHVLDLPDKVYEVIELAPTSEMQRAASIIQSKCPTTIQALTLLRELSDGFQYADEDVGAVEKCPRCKGTRIESRMVYCGPDEDYDSVMEKQSLGQQVSGDLFKSEEQACDYCSGTGEIAKLVRATKEVNTPKEAALNAQLDLHEDTGRIVIFGGFTGSIDRITNICKKAGWNVIRVDGRGWDATIPGDPEKLLQVFQDSQVEKIAFVGQPGAAGLGLNLTASPTIVYWSNDFSAESRIQSEDRIHRPGMDLNKGAKIIDLVCLKSDLMVLNNLKRKRRLQDLTLGQMSEEIAAIKFSDIREY